MTNFDHKQMQTQAELLQRDVLAILQTHVGAKKAIKARNIAQCLGLRSDRTVREAIRQLRRNGHLILSSVGKKPGYFVAATLQEWKEFRDYNLRPRAYDMLSTIQGMSTAAQRTWGSGAGLVIQEPLLEVSG